MHFNIFCKQLQGAITFTSPSFRDLLDGSNSHQRPSKHEKTAFEESITPSRFRTTVLTDIYEQTGDIKLTQNAAGHATPEMTLKHYVKGRRKANDAAQVIDRVYAASVS